jgi:methylated-DNA-protein-cysteine methyltransferase-like protein
MGEFYIDFGRFGWFPAELPSEVSEDGDGDDDTVNVNV